MTRRQTKWARPNAMPGPITLFSQSKPADHVLISRAVFPREIFEQLIAPADKLEQPTSRGMVLLMDIEMLAKVIDALGEERNLHFRRTGILLVDFEICDDLLLLRGCN
jgi:hypothetical protein